MDPNGNADKYHDTDLYADGHTDRYLDRYAQRNADEYSGGRYAHRYADDNTNFYRNTYGYADVDPDGNAYLNADVYHDAD